MLKKQVQNFVLCLTKFTNIIYLDDYENACPCSTGCALCTKWRLQKQGDSWLEGSFFKDQGFSRTFKTLMAIWKMTNSELKVGNTSFEKIREGIWTKPIESLHIKYVYVYIIKQYIHDTGELMNLCHTQIKLIGDLFMRDIFF